MRSPLLTLCLACALPLLSRAAETEAETEIIADAPYQVVEKSYVTAGDLRKDHPQTSTAISFLPGTLEGGPNLSSAPYGVYGSEKSVIVYRYTRTVREGEDRSKVPMLIAPRPVIRFQLEEPLPKDPDSSVYRSYVNQYHVIEKELRAKLEHTVLEKRFADVDELKREYPETSEGTICGPHHRPGEPLPEPFHMYGCYGSGGKVIVYRWTSGPEKDSKEREKKEGAKDGAARERLILSPDPVIAFTPAKPLPKKIEEETCALHMERYHEIIGSPKK